MKSNVAIQVQELSKKYRIGTSKKVTLRESLVGYFSKSSSHQTDSEFWALNDLNFEIQKGEAVGIIGKNGAGKSTLLKVLSRITEPTTGRITLNGRVSSLLEVGTGFHPELTGKENIYLNGTILGMSRKEVKSKFDEIVDFSGVEKFIHTPVKHYSSGMYVRLAFAVAAHLEPEILIIDEVLAVGDAEFQKKCLGKMEDVAQQGRTVIFVSHNMNAVKNLCTKAILLKDGKVILDSNTSDVIDVYLQTQKIRQTYDLKVVKFRKGEQNVKFEWLKFDKIKYHSGEKVSFSISIRGAGDLHITKNIDLGIAIKGANEINLVHMTNRFINKRIPYDGKSKKVEVSMDSTLRPGTYQLTLFLRINGIIQDWLDDVASFEIVDSNPYGYSNTHEITGIILPKYTMNDK